MHFEVLYVYFNDQYELQQLSRHSPSEQRVGDIGEERKISKDQCAIDYI